MPTDLGKIVNRFLTRNFHHYVEYGFTAKMEDDLDEIADGQEAWVPVLDRFWKEFKQQVDLVDESVTREDVSEARELGKDPATRQADLGALRQVRTVRADRHEGRRGEAEVREPAAAPAHGLDHAARRRSSCSSCRARSAHTGRPANRSASRSAASARTCSTARRSSSRSRTTIRTRVELPRALELIRAKEVLDANRIILDFPDAGIQVLNGRYGPYITDRAKNAKIPKDREPKTLTLDECKELIAAAPERSKRGRFGMKVAAKAPAAQPKAEAPAAVSKPEKPVAKSAKSPGPAKQSPPMAKQSSSPTLAKQSSPVSAKAAPKVSVLKSEKSSKTAKKAPPPKPKTKSARK